jgi:hypothetical protein
MLESLHVRPHICVRLRSGPLRSWIDPFVDVLEQRGYTSGGGRRYVHAADAFSAWLIRHRLAVNAIDHSVVARFANSQKRWHRPSSAHGRVNQIVTGVRIPRRSCGITARPFVRRTPYQRRISMAGSRNSMGISLECEASPVALAGSIGSTRGRRCRMLERRLRLVRERVERLCDVLAVSCDARISAARRTALPVDPPHRPRVRRSRRSGRPPPRSAGDPAARAGRGSRFRGRRSRHAVRQ